MAEPGLVVYCECVHGDFMPLPSQRALLQGLRQSGHQIVTTQDLCGLAARRASQLPDWANSPQLTIIACYDRAIRALFAMAGISLPTDDSIRILNPRTHSPKEILDAIGTHAEKPGSEITIEAPDMDDWLPWFPVIDRQRCRNCKLCLNFCLFGVYETDHLDQVQVAQPDHCKTNCPACARVCPAQAIIFPKYHQGPINGEEVDEAVAAQKASQLNRLQDTNVYDLLRQRSGRTQRFSTEPRTGDTMLEFLHQQLDIPMDVLQALAPADLARVQKKASLVKESNES